MARIKEEPIEDNTEETQYEENAGKFACTFCEYTSDHKANYTSHVRSHTGERPFECSLCDAKYTLVYGLKHHIMRKHHEVQQLKCPSCKYKCLEQQDLDRHFLKHKDFKSYSCDICGYKNLTRRSIKKHMLTHSKNKPFQCIICHKTFSHKCELKIHTMTHTGEKPYKCDKCDYKCIQKRQLKQHDLVKHTEEKPFGCNMCDYRSSQRRLLKRHILKHTGEIKHIMVNKRYECNMCDKKFITLSHLNRHIRTHTGEKPFPCPSCDYKSAQKEQLLLHVKKRHIAKEKP